jgi:hypothetical protein
MKWNNEISDELPALTPADVHSINLRQVLSKGF